MRTVLRGPGLAGIAGLIMIGIGYYTVFGAYLPMINAAKKSANWPTVSGTVIESRVKEEIRTETRSRKTASGRRRSSTREKMYYLPIVKYEYVVNSHTYVEGDLFYRSDLSSPNEEAVREIVQQYPLGKTVTVSYSPEEPNNAVLEPGAKRQHYASLYIGIAVLAIGGLLVVTGLLALLRR